MTTILADLRLGVMISDSSISDGDRVWIGRKVWRHKGALIGGAGDFDEVESFVRWFKKPTAKPPSFGNSYALVLTSNSLTYYAGTGTGSKVQNGIEAIGSGGKAAMCAYEALAFTDPIGHQPALWWLKKRCFVS